MYLTLITNYDLLDGINCLTSMYLSKKKYMYKPPPQSKLYPIIITILLIITNDNYLQTKIFIFYELTNICVELTIHFDVMA